MFKSRKSTLMLSFVYMIWTLPSTSTTTLRLYHSQSWGSCSFSLGISSSTCPSHRIKSVFSLTSSRRKLPWTQYWLAQSPAFSIVFSALENLRPKSLTWLLAWTDSSVGMSAFALAATMYSLGLPCSLELLARCSKSFSEEQWESSILTIRWTRSPLMVCADFGVSLPLASLTIRKASFSQATDRFLEFNWLEPARCSFFQFSSHSHFSTHWRRWAEFASQRFKRSSAWTSIWSRIFPNQTTRRRIEFLPMYSNKSSLLSLQDSELYMVKIIIANLYIIIMYFVKIHLIMISI